jgi:hypothetical protein
MSADPNHDIVPTLRMFDGLIMGQAADEIESLRTQRTVLEQQRDLLMQKLNTPEIEDFASGVVLEAAHQRTRWGSAHDRSKSAENWFWLVGYLAGKALRASIDGNREKALHHTISAAAALSNWHQAIKDDPTGCGMGRDEDLQP